MVPSEKVIARKPGKESLENKESKKNNLKQITQRFTQKNPWPQEQEGPNKERNRRFDTPCCSGCPGTISVVAKCRYNLFTRRNGTN